MEKGDKEKLYFECQRENLNYFVDVMVNANMT